MPPRLLALPLAALALVVTACGERSEPLGSLSEQYPVQVHGAGGALVTVKERPTRVVALDPGAAQLVDRLGAGSRLVGAPAGVQLRDAHPATVALPSGAVDVQAVVGLHPDLIVATPGTDPVDLDRAVQGTSAALYVEPDSSVHDVERAAVDLGFVLDRPVRARQLAASIEDGVQRVERRVAHSPTVRVFVDTGFFVPAPADSLLGDLVRRAHGESVGGPNPGQEPLDPARIARLNPRLYLVTSAGGTNVARLRRDPATRRIRAIREGHVAVLPSELVENAGPNVVEALMVVARTLHPHAFR